MWRWGLKTLGTALISLETGRCASVAREKSHVKLCFHLNSVRHSSTGSIMAQSKIDELINANKIVIFSKSYCPFCNKVKELFQSLNETYEAVELDIIPDGAEYQDALIEKTEQRTVPNVFINKVHIGGCDDTLKALADKTLFDFLENTYQKYDYDLIVIGGGSGGLSAAKEAVKYGKRVAVCDFVQPSPAGTTWGLGGTCVNVGCIPKKLMHKAALGGAEINDLQHFGWALPESVEHRWETMVEEIQNYIKSLNFGYKKQLRDVNVTYLNEYATFINNHEIQTTDKKGEMRIRSAQNFIIAVGGRPRYPQIPGAREYGISSDDLFSLQTSPGKTLIVGASYIALECAGFLAGLGIDVTVMVRSILLRGFDRQMADMIGEHMESHGVKFIRECVPAVVEKVSDNPTVLRVTGRIGNDIVPGEYDTVLFAIGRDACTRGLGLEALNVNLNESNGKIIVNDLEESSVRNIFAIGDVIDGKPELTPVAIQAGRLLARRLYGNSRMTTDYDNVPTTVFTPLEYGCVGFSEERAIEYFGEGNIEVYHSHYQPLEYALPNRDAYKSYAKLICLKSEENLVVGLHILGPNAGEITQGFALAIKLGAKIKDFHNLIGIHPTCAEIFTTLYITKSSGISVQKTSC